MEDGDKIPWDKRGWKDCVPSVINATDRDRFTLWLTRQELSDGLRLIPTRKDIANLYDIACLFFTEEE